MTQTQVAGRPAASDEVRRELWGYGVWGLVAVAIGVPELWAVFGAPPWRTISATIGHLEARWSWVAMLVVAAIVVAAADAVSRLKAVPAGAGGPVVTPSEVSESLGRTRSGRTKPAAAAVLPIDRSGWLVYFALSVVVVVASIVAAAGSGSPWGAGYVIYGVIAALFVVAPNVLVVALKKEVPFPTLVQTVANLERRWHPSILIVLALVTILLLHLAFYPWPSIPRPVTPTSA